MTGCQPMYFVNLKLLLALTVCILKRNMYASFSIKLAFLNSHN